MATVTIASMVERWTGKDRPKLFKEQLISLDGACCSQGDVLRCCGWSDDALRELAQDKADFEVARILGMSVTHSILLREINDRPDGCPQDVLTNPAKFIGEHADLVLEFWRYLDELVGTVRGTDWVLSGDWRTRLEAKDRLIPAVRAVSFNGSEILSATVTKVTRGRSVASPALCANLYAAALAVTEIQFHDRLTIPLFFMSLFGVTIEALKARVVERKAAV